MNDFGKKSIVWLFEGTAAGQHADGETEGHKDPWWQVMCLTGTDYFSSMGFQPGIAYMAAGLLSPLATLILVVLTLAGALPAYWLVARESPHGQGSFAIFERLLHGWRGKTLVLVLLGFAATDFVFTITMCAADASAHIVQNPFVPEVLRNRLLITLVLVFSLGAIFIKGFGEAVKISFWLVVSYLAVNVVSLYVCTEKVLAEPGLINDWIKQLTAQYPTFWDMFKTSALVFPQLALGMSGFETGVAVMPLIKVQSHLNSADKLNDRIKNTRKLLVTVALIMSVFLIIGALDTTILIPAPLYKENGAASGRALAYLTHLYLGDIFGTVYDISTILILWFAGASGMAALLSLVPQYLPRYGMAPSWARARRPLVLFFTAVCALVTVIFRANVDAQAGAFATGLLVMITSATVAITLLVWKEGIFKRLCFSLISLAFIYASIVVVRDRPDGLYISLLFIFVVLASSLVSRAFRSTELRVDSVEFDATANKFIELACSEKMGQIRLLAHRPGNIAYLEKEAEARELHSVQPGEGNFIFLEVAPTDVSKFVEETLMVSGHVENGYQILRCSSSGVPNAIAAILMHLRDKTNRIPNAYFGWTEGHPISYVFKYIVLGEGETAPLTREILRSIEPDKTRRPRIHVS